MRRTITNTLGRLAAPALAAVLAAAGLALQAPPTDVGDATPVAGVQGQVHYLPWDAAQFRQALEGQYGSTHTDIASPVRLITSMVSALDGNQVRIDHWEDGYDADPVAAPGSTTEAITLDEGQTRILDNWVDLAEVGDITPGGSSQPHYDGGDKVVSTGAMVITAGGWPSGATTLHAGAAVVRDSNRAGLEFVAPVGEDLTYGTGQSLLPTLWEHVGLVVIATEDGTSVSVDGGPPVALDEGDSHLVDGGVQLGDAVVADKPVHVYLVTGDNSVRWEGRLFGLLPTEAWSDGYLTPVGSRSTGALRTRVFLYNPAPSAISVDYTQSGGGTGTISVPAGGHANRAVPTDQGIRFSSPGNPFYALQAITTPEEGTGNDESSAYNWGFALTPTSALTPMAVIGYGPGSNDTDSTPGPDANDNAVWVAAEADTTVHVDLDADPTTGDSTDADGNQYDFSCPLTALTPRLVKDDGSETCSSISGYSRASGTGDNDMTGARIYTTDGTSLASAWGQVPGAANTGTPAIDMGTTVLPFPTIDLVKDAEIVGDDGDGEAVPGDTIRYTITVTNRGISPVDDLTVNDEVPENTSYVPGSTIAGGSAVADPATGTPFPLDEGGLAVPPVLDVGETRTVVYDLLVDDPLPEGVTEIVNEITLESDYGTYTDRNVTPVAEPGSIGDRVWDDADGDGVQDPGEAGLVGVDLELVDGDDEVVATTTTGADGAYGFDGIYPGGYRVRVVAGTLPPGMAPTHDLDGTGTAHVAAATLAAEETRTDVDFGYATATITLEKTVEAAGGGCPGGETFAGEVGDAVTYCFRVTNTGVIALTDVGVDDPDLGVDDGAMTLVSGDPAALAPSQSVVWSYDTEVDGDLVNTAEAEAFTSGGVRRTATDTAEVDEIGPGIGIEKTVYGGHDGGAGCGSSDGESVQARAGGEVTYCFVVTNTGETNLSAVDVTDPDLGIGAGDLTHALLTPGQSVTLHAETTVAGDLVNTASVVGTSPAGARPTDSDTAEVDEVHPAVEVQKTLYAGHDDGAACAGAEEIVALAGDDVTWCFSVTNTGDVDLTDITVEDLPLGVDEADLQQAVGSLATLTQGATAELYLATTATDDVANSVTVTGVPPVGEPVTDEDTADLDVVDPSVTIDKTVYAGHDAGASCAGGELVQAEPGDEVTYCFTVTNTGEGALGDVRIDDLDLGVDESGLAPLSGDPDPLADGQSATWYLETEVDGDLLNTATVTATPPAGPDVTDDDTAEVDEVNAAISVAKTVYLGHDDGAGCGSGDGESVADENGRPVTWCFLVTNEGDATLTDVRLDDVDLEVDEADLTALSGSLTSLAPGATVQLYLEGAVDGDLVNEVTATAAPPVGAEVSDHDQAEVDELVPGYTVAKTVYAGHDDGAGCPGGESVTARPGDPVTWCVVVENTGDTDLDVEIDDAQAGFAVTVEDLAPGASATRYVEGTVDGDLTNTVLTTGIPPHGPELPGDDTADVDEIQPAIALAKTVYGGHDGGAGCPGGETFADEVDQAVTWCFVVTNEGDSTLTDITIDDLPLTVDEGDLEVLSGSLAALPTGESVVLYLEATLDAAVDNEATATGTPLVGPDVSDTDDASTAVLVPGVTIAKTVYAGHDDGASCEGGEVVQAQHGAAVTWCFLVTNTGDVPLDVTVDDPTVGFDETVTGLAPAASVTLHHDGTVDGDQPNTALVTGDTPDGHEVTDDDGAEVDEIDPSLTVDKSVYLGDDDGASCEGTPAVEAEVGQTATWCFLVTNTGDVALTDVTLDDPVLEIDQGDMTVASGSLTSVAPGGTVLAWYEGVVDGDVHNEVTAEATAPDQSHPSDHGAADVTVIAPQIGVAKTVLDGPVGNGDGTYTLTYRLRVTNAGETALEGVQVTDDLTDTFVGVPSFRVDAVTSTDFTVNPGYTGRPSGSTALLSGGDGLAVGQRGDIRLTVTVEPGDALGPHRNTAVATATSPGGEDVDDLSDSGSDASPVASNPGEPGDSGGTDDPVPVEFPQVDLVVAKTVDDIDVDGDRGTITWRLVVTNDGTGDDPGPVTVTDDLDERLSLVSAEGDGWVCRPVRQLVTCRHDAPLPAGASTAPILLVTGLTVTEDQVVANAAHVASTLGEVRDDNNDDVAGVTAEVDVEASVPATLPRTGLAVGSLVLLGFGLLAGGRALQRRGARAGA